MHLTKEEFIQGLKDRAKKNRAIKRLPNVKSTIKLDIPEPDITELQELEKDVV